MSTEETPHATASTERTPLLPSSSSSSTPHTIHNSPLNRLSSPQISFPKSNRQSSYPFPTIPRGDSYDPLKIYRQNKIQHGDPDFSSHDRPIPSPSAFSSSGLSSMSGESSTAVGTDHTHKHHHHHHHPHHRQHHHFHRQPHRHGTAAYEFGTRHDGLPKLSRECLISEIKCYGRYMIPPLLVFGVLAIGAALIAVSIRRGWI